MWAGFRLSFSLKARKQQAESGELVLAEQADWWQSRCYTSSEWPIYAQVSVCCGGAGTSRIAQVKSQEVQERGWGRESGEWGGGTFLKRVCEGRE